LLEEKHIEIYDTPGDNYVSDLNLVLKSLNDFVLITSGDLPLLDGDIIQKIVNLRHSDNMWTTILVTKEFLHSLNLSSDYEIKYENQICCYTGISLVNTKIINNFESILEKFFVINDKRIAFNLNTKQDYSLLNTT
jgi:adenosylcobinamide-phosphate guanylyltransferase